MLDNSKNRANIISVIKLQKTHDLEVVRQRIINESLRHAKMRSTLVKFAGQYFFKELPLDQLKEHHARNLTYIDSLKSEADIADLAALEQSVRDPLDTLQFKAYFQREFQQHYSLVVFKMHHSVADGVAIVSMTAACTDRGYQRKDYPRLTPKLAPLQKLIATAVMYLSLPYAIY